MREKIIFDLAELIENRDLTAFEREKLSRAKALLDKGEPLPDVLNRLQVTFMEKAVSGDMGPRMKVFYRELYKENLSSLRDVSRAAATGAGFPL